MITCTLDVWAQRHIGAPFDVEVYTVTRVYWLDRSGLAGYAIQNSMVPHVVMTSENLDDIADFLAPGAKPGDIEGVATYGASWPKITTNPPRPKEQPLVVLEASAS